MTRTVLALCLALAACGDRVDPVAIGTDAGATDGGMEAGSGQDGAGPADSGGGEDVVASRPDAGSCVLADDGTIRPDQIAYMVGATAIYVVNREGTVVDGVDTAGADTTEGRVWDFSEALPDDHRVLDEVMAPDGQWWSAAYPTASFATFVDREKAQLGVYRAGGDGLELLGIVSQEMLRTNLQMTPPVRLLRLPMAQGDSWSQTVTGTGFVDFVALTNVTSWTFAVDARGEVRTPAGGFPALRLRASLDQSVPGTLLRRTQRIFTWVSPCWGVVARIASVDDETAAEPTRASEYRRLGL